MGAYDADLVAALPAALAAGELVLHYQPEVDLASGEVVALEALLRWRHPLLGLLAPGEFLPGAEAAGLDVALGDWVVAQVVAEAALWQRLPAARRTTGKQVWVNVTGGQLASAGFVDRVAALLAEAGLPPRTVGFELREAAVSEGVTPVLLALRAVGVALALDDFGGWDSALSHLDELPVDTVKLDHRYVRDVGRDPDDDAFVAAVIGLAHAAGRDVVAEGVETWDESARLCELGCDRAHGYLFSGPQAPERARWLLSRGVGWAPDITVPRPRGAEAAQGMDR